MKALSPLTNKEAVFIDNINVKRLKKDFLENLGVDVSSFFNELIDIQIFECQQTGYRFYYPFNISGNSDFYKELQKFDWYYMPWKWENEYTLKYLKGDEKILEVGSGGLGFIEKLKNRGFDIKGLELNEESVNKGKEKGIIILNETVQDHAIKNMKLYDLVCSFQVLEHISDVHSFIKGQVDCLKKGGKLIISVPNNDSFIKFSDGGILNKPPHHMGLWNKKSLQNLCMIFDLKIDKIFYEPLQDYHVNWYVESIKKERILSNRFYGFLYRKLKLNYLFTKIVSKFKKNIKGHSIMVIYTKN